MHINKTSKSPLSLPQITQAVRFLAAAVALLSAACSDSMNASGNPENHGAAVPVGMPSWGPGVYAIENAEGRPEIFVSAWTKENWGGTFLWIDPETGKSEQMDPKIPGYPMTTYLAKNGRLYTTFTYGAGVPDTFVEFDPVSRKIIHQVPFPSRYAFSITEDKSGLIYLATMPGAQLLTYDPETRELKEFTRLAVEDWPQYPTIAIGEDGWIYATIMYKAGNLIAVHPETGDVKPLLDEASRTLAERRDIYRGDNGKVYARLDQGPWFELFEGQATEIDKTPPASGAASQMCWRDRTAFPSGGRIVDFNMTDSHAVVELPGEGQKTFSFDYAATGAMIYSIAATADGTIVGSTGSPLRFFRFDPETGISRHWRVVEAGTAGHLNDLAVLDGKIYGGLYSCGALLEIDENKTPVEGSFVLPSRRVYPDREGQPASSLFGRPFVVRTHPDGRHIIMTGNPSRALLGGGMLIYDAKSGESEVFESSELVPRQGIRALAILPDGNLVAGSTAASVTGGSESTGEPMMMIFDWKTRKALSRHPLPFGKGGAVMDLAADSGGRVFGIASGSVFFVFDPETGTVVHSEKMGHYGNTIGTDGTRCLVWGPDGALYAAFRDALVRIDPKTLDHEAVMRPPVPITQGLVEAGNRIYFACGPELWSFVLPED